MGDLTIPCGFAPRDYQLPLFQAMDSGCRKALLVWPRQIGKDTSCWAFMCKEACKKSGNYFYVFPTKEDARRALWEKILDDGNKLVSYIPDAIITRKSNQEMVIEVTAGDVISTIRVVGLDKNPDAIRGVTPQGVVFSEFAFSDPDAYKSMIPALRRPGNWIIINSTPNGRNHFYDMREGVKGADGWYLSEYQALWPERDNFIHVEDPEYFESLVNEGIMTWEDIEREYGCSFATGMKGAYYINDVEKATAEGRVGDYCYDDNLLVDTFWDIGTTDDTVVWFRQCYGNKIMFIDYYEMAGKPPKHFIEMLGDRGYRYGTHYLPHDGSHKKVQHSSNLSTQDMMEDLLISLKVTGDTEVLPKISVQDGINAVRSRFRRYHFDMSKTYLGLKHLELYHRKWDKRRKSFLKDPVHDGASHAADALRMEGLSADYADHYNPFPKEVKTNSGIDLTDLW